MKELLAALDAGDLGAAREAADALDEVARTLGSLDEVRLRHIARLIDLGESAAALIHEVRQPLLAVKSYSQMIEYDESADARSRERAAAVVEYADQCEAMLERLSRYSRGQRADAEIQLCAMNDAIHSAVGMLRLDKARGVGLELELAEALPQVNIDASELLQVLANLLGNARQAMEPDGGRIVVRSSADAGGVTVIVSDEGPGVPAGLRERIFAAFETTKEHGTGLGLHVSRRIIETAGGRLELMDSEVGAAFRAWLPVGR